MYVAQECWEGGELQRMLEAHLRKPRERLVHQGALIAIAHSTRPARMPIKPHAHVGGEALRRPLPCLLAAAQRALPQLQAVRRITCSHATEQVVLLAAALR